MAKRKAIIGALLSFLLLFPGEVLPGEGEKEAGVHISFGLGVERLEYEEDEPVTTLHSRGSTYNLTARINATKRWQFLLAGLCGTFPLVAGRDGESWSAAGAPFQTNKITYRRSRYSGYIGYPISPLVIPYTGISHSRSSQTRSDFIVTGTPVAGSAKEKVISTSFLLGLRGQGNPSPRFRWSYGLALFLPVHVDVTNSSLPGFRADETSGYGYEFNLDIVRMHSEKFGYGLSLNGGVVHWRGSDFLPYSGGFAKWPENDTRYLGGAVTLHLLL